MELIERLRLAWARRAEFARTSEVVRTFDGAGDGIPGLFIDRMGSVGIAHIVAGECEPGSESELERCASSLLELYGIGALYRWVHRRDARESAAGGGTLLAGVSTPAVWCREGTLRFLVKPEANVNGGLFLDTREIRAELLHSSNGGRVLNTFCFTGSLGIAAWCGGAREVVQVDISKGVLQWARGNLEGNVGVGSGEMRFIAEDSRSFMERELRRIKRGDKVPFDTVIVDPPSFGSSGGVTFSFKEDIGELLALAFQLLATEGRLFFTTNFRQIELHALERLVRDAAGSAQRTIASLENLRPPTVDFTASLEESFAMRGLLVRLG